MFEVIQQSSNTPWREMYSVFNMGHRMEVICNETFAQEVIKSSKKFGVDAKIIGVVEKSNQTKNSVKIESEFGTFEY